MAITIYQLLFRGCEFMPKTTLETLPSVLKLSIFSFLNRKELTKTTTRVSKDCNTTASHPGIWKQVLKASTGYQQTEKHPKAICKIIFELSKLSPRYLLFAMKTDSEINQLIQNTPCLSQIIKNAIRRYNQLGDLIIEKFSPSDTEEAVIFDAFTGKSINRKFVYHSSIEEKNDNNNLRIYPRASLNEMKQLIQDRLKIIARFLNQVFNSCYWKINYNTLSVFCESFDLRAASHSQMVNHTDIIEVDEIVRGSFRVTSYIDTFNHTERSESKYEIDDLEYLAKIFKKAIDYLEQSDNLLSEQEPAILCERKRLALLV